jgi:hypothetical protein
MIQLDFTRFCVFPAFCTEGTEQLLFAFWRIKDYELRMGRLLLTS